LDVLENGPARPNRTARVGAVLLATAVVAVAGAQWLSQPAHSTKASRPSAVPQIAGVAAAQFSSDWNDDIRDDKTFVLQFKIVNVTGAELTVQARPVPAASGIRGLTAFVLPAAAWSRPDLDLGATGASPLMVPRGGYAVYALAGVVTCFRYGPEAAGTALLILNEQLAGLSLPKIDDKPYPDYLTSTACT
jgi:hypothetical protein